MGCRRKPDLAFVQARLPTGTLSEVEAHARVCASCHELLRVALGVSRLENTEATDRLGPTPMPRASTRPPLAKGTSIGRYTVLELVGRGGMGEVYSAYDPGLDRRVALKLMHADGAAADPLGQERLLREAQAIAKLSHRLAEAEEAFRRALSLFGPIWRSIRGAERPRRRVIEERAPRRSESKFQTILRAQQDAASPEEELAQTQLKLATALARAHHEPTRVHDLAAQAVAVFTRLRSFERERQEAEALLGREVTSVAR